MVTVNYSWTLPTIGETVDTWGALLNSILTDIDAKMFARTGGTISGPVSVAGDLSISGSGGIRNTYTSAAYVFGPSSTEQIYRSGNTLRFFVNGADVSTLDASGNLLPGGNGTQAFGSTSLRWSQVWCTAGAFNTSDATLKTKVSKFNSAEIQAAIALSKEIGWFQWLDAVKDKGEEKARHHVGLTVQRAAEVLESFSLDPWIFGFMSHDVWDDQITEHPAIEAKEAVLDGDGNVIEEAVEDKEAWSEVTLKAGESYAFRYDQLNLFIARGLEARLAALETRA